MPDIFTVNESDATAIQQRYEQLIEVLLKAVLNVKQDSDKQGLKIFDGDKLVYGHDENQFRDEVSGIGGQLLNPQLIAQLQQLRSTQVGEVVDGAINKRIELDGEVLVQSDSDGKVIVNNFLQQEAVTDIKPSKEYSDNINQIIQPELSPPDYIQEEISSSTIPGSTRVAESLQVLVDSPLKTLLSSEIEQLKAEVKSLQQERNLYQELIEQRLKQPQNTSWWQQVVNNASTVVSSVTSAVKIGLREYKENSKQHQFAASIKNLFQLQTQPGENQYQAGDYQISRSGSLYEVKDSATDKFLIQFRETPLGVKVEKGDLASLNIQDINSLQNYLRKNEPVPASFAPVGKQEAEYFARVERVTNALTQYAVAQQTDVEIDGRFSYKWKASSNGNVQIEAKDGRGNLLEKTGGQLTSNMNERDLIYFEQILPKLQPRNHKQVTISQFNQVTDNSLER
ncbi:hypothetical protein IQ247_29285 [Plectonema cf. radiosum LEGE 06105]|uniref:Uncharacterized protein n=1 Tax=Plectonema cf. radiosum LEGE 06105 TaxID=945769 RepID=A0A8J7F6S9_9CYAN|nr:hypothetical protein [Plectonema radiosum]MBE9216703.1 hypothetical protein [Plectonema cf. radiosum LEGE 06105]